MQVASVGWRPLGVLVLGLMAAGLASVQSAPVQTSPGATLQDEVDPPGQDEPAQDAPAQAPAEEPGEQVEPARPGAYRFLDERDVLLSSWMGRGFVERLDLGDSAGGRELFAVQFGGPGPVPLSERTTILLLGGLDGLSISGSEAVLAITDSLLSTPERLPLDVTFVAVPWANPDGLARSLVQRCGAGRNDRAIDDDRDGQVDEDPPDDVDSDGVVLEMLLEDPNGPWVRSSDPRFLRPAREGEAPRYIRLREGRDDDGDGLYNEDPAGGVALDLNFPVGWEGEWGGRPTGPWPLSEKASRRLADFALERRTAVVLLFQGNHGLLATPGGSTGAGALELPFEQDLPTYSQAVELFARTTGRSQAAPLTLLEARGGPRPGAAIDWFYTALGALAMEVAVWGPEVENDVRETVDAQFVRGRDEGGDGATGNEREIPSAADTAWARWLDDTLGGLGFVDWHPVDLGDGRQGLVGGWQAETCFNPPEAILPLALNGLDGFALQLAKSLPSLKIEILEQSRDGRVALIRAQVENGGSLPSGVGPGGAERAASLRLDLPQGVTLLAGELTQSLGHLPGNGASQEFSWLIVSPPESLFQLVVESRWSPAEVIRVKL